MSTSSKGSLPPYSSTPPQLAAADSGSSAAAPPPDHDGHRRSSWPAWFRNLNADSAQGILLLFSVVIAKVIVVAKGDLTTALAIMNTSGPVTVVVGVVVSLLPILSAILFSIGVYYLVSGGLGWWRSLPGSRWIKLFIAAVVTAAFVTLTPWFIFSGSLILALIGGLYSRRFHHRHRIQLPVGVRGALPIVLICCVLAVPVAQDIFFQIWLPREQLQIKDPPKLTIGYVLNDEDGWMWVLTSGDRRVLQLKSETVTSRALCRRQNNHESILQFARRHSPISRFRRDMRIPLECSNFGA